MSKRRCELELPHRNIIKAIAAVEADVSSIILR
jgi:hypothetical protein